MSLELANRFFGELFFTITVCNSSTIADEIRKFHTAVSSGPLYYVPVVTSCGINIVLLLPKR